MSSTTNALNSNYQAKIARQDDDYNLSIEVLNQQDCGADPNPYGTEPTEAEASRQAYDDALGRYCANLSSNNIGPHTRQEVSKRGRWVYK